MGDNIIDFEGQKITLGSDFTAGKFGFQDAWELARDILRESNIYQMVEKQLKVKEFLYDLKKGETNALLIAIITFFFAVYLSITLLSYVISTVAPSSSSSSSSTTAKKSTGYNRNGSGTSSSGGGGGGDGGDDVDLPDPPRDFTIEQLREFDGSNDKPIYIALRGEVYDVSSASDFYGEGSGYHCFAGREASRAMARLSFEEVDLANPNVDDLGPFDRSTLDDWIQKFKYYKCYPVVGKVSTPPPVTRTFTREQLSFFNGLQNQPQQQNENGPAEEKGEGEREISFVNDPKRVDVPIYVGINGKVVDVSYGGKAMYGVGGPYNIFAGKDASRSLAKMSFKPEDLNSHDLSDLTPEQEKTLREWEVKFVETRKYPIVGTLVD